MLNNFPKAITVTFHYDKHIQRITKKRYETAVISQGMPFLLLLFQLFKSYPKIERTYPPGILGFTVNGKPPQEFDEIQEGDVIKLFIPWEME